MPATGSRTARRKRCSPAPMRAKGRVPSWKSASPTTRAAELPFADHRANRFQEPTETTHEHADEPEVDTKGLPHRGRRRIPGAGLAAVLSGAVRSGLPDAAGAPGRGLRARHGARRAHARARPAPG